MATRAEARTENRKDVQMSMFRLYQLLELDTPEVTPQIQTEMLNLQMYVNRLIKPENHRETPLLNGLQEKVPLGVPVTLQMVASRDGGKPDYVRTYQAKVQRIGGAHPGREEIRFYVIRRRCKKEERLYYWASPETTLKIWHGYVNPDTTQQTPLYEYSPLR